VHANSADKRAIDSILYLFLLFAVLLGEHGLGLFWPIPGLAT